MSADFAITWPNLSDLSPEAQEIIRACDLVRASGYAVMPQHEFDLWSRWLREAHDQSRANDDAYVLAVQQLTWLEDRVREHLNGSRPAWWRRHIRAAKAMRDLWVKGGLRPESDVLSGGTTAVTP